MSATDVKEKPSVSKKKAAAIISTIKSSVKGENGSSKNMSKLVPEDDGGDEKEAGRKAAAVAEN